MPTWDNHPIRTLIVDAVRSRPGLTKSELARATGLAWGTLGHHLFVLSRAQRLVLIKAGRHLRVAPCPFEEAEDANKALAAPLAREALHVLVQGERRPSEVARILGVTNRRAMRHLDALATAGLVHCIPGHPPNYHPTDRAARVERRSWWAKDHDQRSKL